MSNKNAPKGNQPKVDLEAVAEWVGLHYGRNFKSEPQEKQDEWLQRYATSHEMQNELAAGEWSVSVRYRTRSGCNEKTYQRINAVSIDEAIELATEMVRRRKGVVSIDGGSVIPV